MATTRYGTLEAQQLYARRLLDSLRSQPQFSGVAISDSPILTGSSSVFSFDPAWMGMNEKKVTLEAKTISPEYFATMGIPLLSGRTFNDLDRQGATPVTIINQSLARRFFPGQDPVGKMLRLGTETVDERQVVGVVADTRDVHLYSREKPQVYEPLAQNGNTRLILLVRTPLPAPAAAAQLKIAIWAVDKDQPIDKLRSLSEVISESVAEPRFRTWLLAAFALTGLSLTLIGIYGVIAYSVGRRTQEMGIRIALGAQSGNVLGLVLREGAALALAGAVFGVLGSYFLTKLLTKQLFQIKPGDPPTLIGAALLMVIVALVASYVPARRATKVDPMVALRHE